MGENDAEQFRCEAKECRQLAERATSPVHKEPWLRLAEDWIKYAEEAKTSRPGWQAVKGSNPESGQPGPNQQYTLTSA